MKDNKLDLLQRGVIMKTSQAQKEVPAVSYTYKPDVTEFYKLFSQYNQEKWQPKITLNSVFLKIIADGVKCAPLLNSTLQINDNQLNGRIITHPQVNIDVPWLLENGKIVPITFMNVQDKRISELADQAKTYKQRIANTNFETLYQKMLLKQNDQTAANSIHANEVGEGTITVTNIGSICHYPGELTQAVILPPQVATIAIGYAEDKLVLNDNVPQVRKILPINISFDHRVLNFNDLVSFIARLDQIFQNPEKLLSSNY